MPGQQGANALLCFKAPMSIQLCKLEQDVLTNGGSMKVGQHFSGASFPVQVHDDSKHPAETQKWGQGAGTTCWRGKGN